MSFRSVVALLATVLTLGAPASAQELRGHGGPVRALAVTADGAVALSGSFDTSAILWGIEAGAALAVLRFHDGPVNAVAVLPEGRFATGGEEGRVAIWRLGRPEPERALEGHAGAVSGLAVSPDGRVLASSSWDATVRLTALAGGETQVLSGHRGPVSALAFSPDGRTLVTASHDMSVRFTPLDGSQARMVELGVAVASLAIAPDGEILAGAADGKLYIMGPDGTRRGEMALGGPPLIAVAVSADGVMVAAAAINGAVALISRANRRVERTLVGPGLPVWSLAFRPGSDEVLTGGGDRLIRRWRVSTGEHLGPVIMARPADLPSRYAGDRGAEVFKACIACHTLEPDGGNRAGPTLHGVIGRRIATAPGYVYSEALRGMDIVWTKDTIARLFEIGPNAYTPGTKMPEQTLGDDEDRQALVDFIARASAP
ncbi:c-type cytochrome [Phreatobacter aquaticus]|uniref:C-type cytochrome n=1 Tax=Phreatobacter aquaticus TaxID=2570229 RepID=A0A4D7QPT5_9HYPH|nr:c-type cytochrome [Phreatobacter aquaticus]QCK86947.1 c-type cytochrome [Phreatobacter aquaticus]